MSPETKKFLDDCERHLRRDNNEEFGDLARDDLPSALRIIREQAKALESAQAKADGLKAAIRRITVDEADGTPVGAAETAIVRIESAMEPSTFFADPSGARVVVCDAMETLCDALADESKLLREAADVYFGEDFTNP